MTLPVYTRTLPVLPTSLRWRSNLRHRAYARKTHAQAQGMTTLITFDVDGTLIRTVGTDSNRCILWAWPPVSPLLCLQCKRHMGCCRLHKEAFAHAWRNVFDLETDIDTMKHHGLTDPLILVSMLEHHGTPHSEVGVCHIWLLSGVLLGQHGRMRAEPWAPQNVAKQHCARLQASCCQQLAFM